MLRSRPAFHVDFTIRDPSPRLQKGFVLTSPGAELTFPVRRDLDADRRSPQVSHVAKKRYRTLAVPVLHFAVRWTHPAQRLDMAVNTLRHPASLPIPQLQQGFLPNCLHSSLANCERLLLRDHTNADLPVRINCKRIHSSPAEIHGVDP